MAYQRAVRNGDSTLKRCAHRLDHSQFQHKGSNGPGTLTSRPRQPSASRSPHKAAAPDHEAKEVISLKPSADFFSRNFAGQKGESRDIYLKC